MRGLKNLAAVSYLLGLALVNAVQATTVVQMSNRELAEQAKVIAIGRCSKVESAWIGRELMTVATVEIAQVYKGQAVNTLQVITPGGVDFSRSPAIARVYPGAPQLSMSQNVFLFLDPEQSLSGTYGVVGYNQGMFEIVRTEQGQQVVTRDLRSVNLDSGNGVRQGVRRSVPLQQFTDNITSYTDHQPIR